jgi:hypothetical protein
MAIATGTAIALGATAALGAGASIYGASQQAKASKGAARTQAQAASEATRAQQQQYYQTREDLGPYRQAGYGALGQLTAGTAPGAEFNQPFTMADFQADPGYQFRLAEGQKALERGAGARGQLFSGATMKDLTRFGQQTASDEYQRAMDRFNVDRTTRFNRLASLAGLGQTANTTLGQLGAQTAGQIGENIIGAGNARAAGQIGAANAWAQGIGGISNALNQTAQNAFLFQALRPQQQFPTYGGGLGF